MFLRGCDLAVGPACPWWNSLPCLLSALLNFGAKLKRMQNAAEVLLARTDVAALFSTYRAQRELQPSALSRQAAQSVTACTRRLSRNLLKAVGRDATKCHQAVSLSRRKDELLAAGNPGRQTPKAVQRRTSGTNQQDPMPSMSSRMSCAVMIASRFEGALTL